MSTVSCKERDYLDQDPEIRGQKFVCLSFLSPEEILQKKDQYVFNKFLGHFADDINILFNGLQEKFKDDPVVIGMLKNVKERHDYVQDTESLSREFYFFKETNGDKLDKDFLEENDFQTSIRGIKVRGSYDTLIEARKRADNIKRLDDKFDVYVAEVGCWCPWSPVGHSIEDQEFSETQLNTLMKKYRENINKRDTFYQERMRDSVSTPATTEIVNIGEETPTDIDVTTDSDPTNVDTVTDPTNTNTDVKSDDVVTQSEPPPYNDVITHETVQVLDQVDPWLASKETV